MEGFIMKYWFEPWLV